MLNRQPKRSYPSGFTLLEILVVMLIIGITISFAVMAFGDFGANRRTRMSSEHFVAYLRLLQHKAILEGRILGLEIQPNRYQSCVFKEKTWIKNKNHSIFKPQTLPTGVQIYFLQKNIKHRKLIVHSSGDMEPFSLYFGTPSQPKLYNVRGTHDGKISIDEKP